MIEAFLLTLAVVALAGCGALGVWAFWREPRSLAITRIAIASPGWPAGAPPLRIALLADPHGAGPHDTPARFARAVAMINDEAPDIALLLGDYVDTRKVKTRFVPPEASAREFGRLRAPLGVYAVLGNHDWEFDAERTRRAFEAVGIAVLNNVARRVAAGAHSFWLAGVGDAATATDDLPGTLEQVSGDEPVLIMTHSPDVFPEVPERIALTVAGHTHGGQVRLPLLGTPVVPSRFGQRYVYGHVVEGGRHLFVTRGIGHSVLPVRFRCPPEIVLLTLRHAATA